MGYARVSNSIKKVVLPARISSRVVCKKFFPTFLRDF